MTKVKVPTPTTTAHLLRYYLEICAPVSRDTVLLLAQFAPTEEVKTFLLSIGRDRAAYTEFLARTHVNLGRLLELSAKLSGTTWSGLPLAAVIETLPAMQPRYYSISSSSAVAPRAPTITAVVSNTPLINNVTETIPGLATNYLLAHHQSRNSSALPTVPTSAYDLNGPNGVLEGRKVFAQVRRSKFRLPALSSHPIIMIAAGTGLAPFRGFISERAQLKKMGRPVGRMLLFFGCRSPEEDYIYSSELEDLRQALDGELTITTAFSRVPGQKKAYVQDRVQEQADEVAELVYEKDATVYVCGSANMAREVSLITSEILRSRNGWDDGQLRTWMDQRKRSRRYQEDVWG